MRDSRIINLIVVLGMSFVKEDERKTLKSNKVIKKPCLYLLNCQKGTK